MLCITRMQGRKKCKFAKLQKKNWCVYQECIKIVTTGIFQTFYLADTFNELGGRKQNAYGVRVVYHSKDKPFLCGFCLITQTFGIIGYWSSTHKGSCMREHDRDIKLLVGFTSPNNAFSKVGLQHKTRVNTLFSKNKFFTITSAHNKSVETDGSWKMVQYNNVSISTSNN